MISEYGYVFCNHFLREVLRRLSKVAKQAAVSGDVGLSFFSDLVRGFPVSYGPRLKSSIRVKQCEYRNSQGV